MTIVKNVLVCGSISYDTIMSCDDRFGEHILPSRLHSLNVAFHVPRIRKGFGGCAANICYNLKLLECSGIPVATVGHDFHLYRDRFAKLGIDHSFIKVIDSECTPQDYITTDPDNNQIASFHPGAMDLSHQNPIDNLEECSMALISPDGLEGMRLHARQFADAGIPFLLDPGQVTTLLGSDELRVLVEQARWAIFNSYEWEIFEQRTGYDHDEMAARLDAHIVTSGGDGSTVYLPSETLTIPAGRVTAHADPTGCGDAYRAGMVFGILHDLDWRATGQIGSTVGAACYESEGSQNHTFSSAELYSRYRRDFGESPAVRRALLGGE